MRRLILLLTILAAGGMVVFKVVREPSATDRSDTTVYGSRPLLFLFHDPSDQDPACRQIYSLVDRAEKALAGPVEVRRPDIRREAGLLEQFQVHVLPTVLLVSSQGTVEKRFEGEGPSVIGGLEEMLEELKERHGK